jgi:hypothetical protein
MYRRFGGSDRLRLQGRKAGPASNKGSSDIDFFLLEFIFFASLNFYQSTRRRIPTDFFLQTTVLYQLQRIAQR